MTHLPVSKKTRFVVDNNLGRLAKWLRLLGYDTLCYKAVSLFAMSRVARKEGRLFLTRSKKNAGLKIFENPVLIKSSDVFEQLRELTPILEVTEERLFSRCSRCNQTLNTVKKEKIESLIPQYIYQNHQEFKMCCKCGRIFWKGTHYAAIREKAREISEKSSG